MRMDLEAGALHPAEERNFHAPCTKRSNTFTPEKLETCDKNIIVDSIFGGTPPDEQKYLW